MITRRHFSWVFNEKSHFFTELDDPLLGHSLWNYTSLLLTWYQLIKIPNVQCRASTMAHLKVERLASACSFSNFRIGQGNLPKGFLHIGHTCCATHHWHLMFSTSPLPLLSFLPRLFGLLSPPGSALLSCFVLPLLSPLLLSSSPPPLYSDCDGGLIPPAYGCHWRPSSP